MDKEVLIIFIIVVVIVAGVVYYFSYQEGYQVDFEIGKETAKLAAEVSPEKMMKKPSEFEMKPHEEMPAPNSGEGIEPSPEQKMELQRLLELFQLIPSGQAGSSPQSFLHSLTQFLADISAVLKF